MGTALRVGWSERWVCVVGLAVSLAGPGCGAPKKATRESKPDGLQALSGACEYENLTQPCGCGAAPGRQACVAGSWAACECSGGDGAAGSGGGTGTLPTFEGNLRSDITFEWVKTPRSAGDGSCLPGEYEGNFHGIYYSALAPMGLGVPVLNFEAPGAPSGFHFSLAPAQGGERIQKVKGEMTGTADGVFPFTAMIEGELDCPTSTFTATLIMGRYSVLTDGVLPQSFEGVMSGHYDKRTHTFVDGAWDVRETTASPPGMLAPTLPRDFKRDGYGGDGGWAAALATDVADPTLTACPTNYTCGAGPLGPNKLLCNTALGTPTCLTDADCNTLFPGEGVLCLKASAFSLCLRECKP
jgi:hypothetical protein